jgi:hypothetical protein
MHHVQQWVQKQGTHTSKATSILKANPEAAAPQNPIQKLQASPNPIQKHQQLHVIQTVSCPLT